MTLESNSNSSPSAAAGPPRSTIACKSRRKCAQHHCRRPKRQWVLARSHVTLPGYFGPSGAIAAALAERKKGGPEAPPAATPSSPPFSFGRMTWIKPSFLWLMERSNWGLKSGRERVLAVRITRAGWEQALAWGVLTDFERDVHGTAGEWRTAFDAALVHVLWGPERSLRGANLPCRSIQGGISRHVIGQFVEEWIVGIEDLTPQVRKIRAHLDAGDIDKAKRLLPAERVYPVPAELAAWMGMA